LPPDLHALLTDPTLVQQLGPGLYTALPGSRAVGLYDRHARSYDAVLGRPLYHRAVWGCRMASFAAFARDAYDASGGDPFAEIGCGSLLFTAQMYREASNARAVLIDRSLPMLRRGMDRLGPAVSDQLVGLQADAAGLPLRTGAFATLLSLNLLHVHCDRGAIIAQCGRLLAPGGRLFVSSIAKTGRLGDASLRFYQRTGVMGPPLTADELTEAAAGTWGRVQTRRIEGSMVFLVVGRA
jgi:SAM-dependent methyltransferase